MALLKNADSGIAMLPQPYVTVAMNSVEGLNIAINLNEEWKKIDSETLFITGVLVARSDFLDANTDRIKRFLNEYKDSIEYANENIKDASLLVEKYGIFAASIAEKAIPFCNLQFINGTEMKTVLSGYLNTLYTYNANAVGGNMPADDFYYAN